MSSDGDWMLVPKHRATDLPISGLIPYKAFTQIDKSRHRHAHIQPLDNSMGHGQSASSAEAFRKHAGTQSRGQYDIMYTFYWTQKAHMHKHSL